jgi:hypothetical protein
MSTEQIKHQTMGPKNQRSAPRRSETVPTYDDARNCVRNDTQTMDQTSDLPRNQNEAEEAHTERETQLSSSSSSSVMEEPVLPGTGSRYRNTTCQKFLPTNLHKT